MNRQFLLDTPPSGKLTRENFRRIDGAVPEPAEGEAQVRTRYISMDAANRAWMQGATYRSALTGGMVWRAPALERWSPPTRLFWCPET